MNDSLKPRYQLVHGQVLHFLADPGEHDAADSYQYFADGALWIEDGHIADVGPWSDILGRIPPAILGEAEVFDYSGKLILPGLVDTHCHYPQSGIIASFGRQLLDWLNDYTFPAEAAFCDPAVGSATADYFVERMLAHGTTTASVFSTVHPESVDAFMASAERHNLRMLTGKVMMDRNAPPALTDTAESGYADSKDLIGRWHGKGRQLYAITPRFAVTSTPEQMAASQRLVAEHPDCFVQTHINENRAEIAFARELYPDAADYAGIYEDYGLLGHKSLLGHCIHMTKREWRAFAQAGAIAVFCPTSNLFLGSGLFDWQRARHEGVKVAVATDIGGGTSYSMLRTMAEAYKILQLQGQSLSTFEALHAITLGNAVALGLDQLIGSFEPGREADVVVLDPAATRVMAHRLETVRDLAEELFVLVTLGDERNVAATYVMGELATSAGA